MRAILSTLLIFFAAVPVFCAAAPVDTAAVKPLRQAELVRKDANLYRIDDKLYRSEQPVGEDAATIKKLGIKSIVNLRYFNRRENDKYLKGQGMILINRPLRSWRIKPADIAETLYLIERQQQQGAVLVHCYHGADRTGLISGMYRIVYHGWPVEEAKAEMQHGPYGYHSIWRNIANLFTEETVRQVKQHLAELKRENPIVNKAK